MQQIFKKKATHKKIAFQRIENIFGAFREKNKYVNMKKYLQQIILFFIYTIVVEIILF